MLHLIVAYGRNGVIGRDGTMPWDIPEDLQHFKALTMGHTVIMGRRTYESIGRALPGRQNIVVSTTMASTADYTVASSLQQALELADRAEVFIIGGAMLYEQALPLADQLDITLVEAEPVGDTWFPTVDWQQFEETARQEHGGYQFRTYRRK